MNEDLLARFRHGMAQNGDARRRAARSWSASCADISTRRVAERMPIAKVHRISATAPDDVSGIEAAIAERPHRSGRHRGDPRQDRRQRQRQRFHPRLSRRSTLTLLLERHLGERATRRLPGDVRRHRGRDGAALDRVRARRGRRRMARRSRSAARTRRHCSPSSSAGWRRSTRSPPACGPRWRDAGIADPADVHFVQIKCPLLTAQRIAEAERARRRPSRPATR